MLLLAALLTLKIIPSACFAPCTVSISVRVERQADNRWVAIQLDGENLFRATTIQLDGDQAPITQTPFVIKSVPAGVYEVTAVLYNTTKEVERRKVELRVAGEGQQLRKK